MSHTWTFPGSGLAVCSLCGVTGDNEDAPCEKASVVEAAAKAMVGARYELTDDQYPELHHLAPSERATFLRMARAALAPLLVQLQDKNERIKALEAKVQGQSDALARLYAEGKW